MDLIWDYLDMEDSINAETKLKAIEEFERIKEKLSLEQMVHDQIQSNFKMVIEIDSSQLIIPIEALQPDEESKL